jgi:hypothetical protein
MPGWVRGSEVFWEKENHPRRRTVSRRGNRKVLRFTRRFVIAFDAPQDQAQNGVVGALFHLEMRAFKVEVGLRKRGQGYLEPPFIDSMSLPPSRVISMGTRGGLLSGTISS